MTHNTLWFLVRHVSRPFHFLCSFLLFSISLGDNQRRLSHNDGRVKQSLIWSTSLFRVCLFRSLCGCAGTNINYRKNVQAKTLSSCELASRCGELESPGMEKREKPAFPTVIWNPLSMYMFRFDRSYDWTIISNLVNVCVHVERAKINAHASVQSFCR